MPKKVPIMPHNKCTEYAEESAHYARMLRQKV